MKADNSFDRMLKHCPSKIKDAAIYVVDTLDLSYKAAQAIFGDDVNPEIALKIYDRICAEINKENISCGDYLEDSTT